MMANLLKAVDLPAGWEQWGIPVAGVVVAGVAFVVGRRLLTARPAVAPAAAKTGPDPDPFEVGSAFEKRVAARRKGASLEVWITDEEGELPRSALVVDRSLGGLGLSCESEIEVGTFLRVRPKDAPTMAPWVDIEVRSCKFEDGTWQLGCSFRKVPPYSVLLLFG